MRFFRRLSIKNKLIILIVSVSFVSIFSIFAYTTYVEIQHIHNELSRNTLKIAETVGSYAVTDLAFGDKAAATKTLEKLQNLPNLVASSLFDNKRELFAHFGPEINLHNIDLERPVNFIDNSLYITHNIIENGRNYGYLYLHISTREHDEEILTTVILGSAFFIAVILLSFYLATKLQNIISQPIIALADFAQQVETHQDFSQHIEKISDDEIGKLYDRFNHLLASIEQKQTQRDIAETELKLAKDELEIRVKNRTKELEVAVSELEAFSYSVSHDLRTPLRSVDGFSNILLEDYADLLDKEGKGYLLRIRNATKRMNAIIDDILLLSRISRADLDITNINLTDLCHTIIDQLHDLQENKRDITITIQPDMHILGDKKLIMLAFENLIGNAWKYTRYQSSPVIEIMLTKTNDEDIISIKDNGAGFDMQYSNKLFDPLQRLHKNDQFEGTGIGLATVHRILSKHGASIRGEGEIDHGACFWVTLPTKYKPHNNTY